MEFADSLPILQRSKTSPFHEAVEYDVEIYLLLFAINFNSILPYVPIYTKRSSAIIFFRLKLWVCTTSLLIFVVRSTVPTHVIHLSIFIVVSYEYCTLYTASSCSFLYLLVLLSLACFK
jgi:hypothetical protein